MCGDLLQLEVAGEHSCSPHLIPEVLVQVPRAGQTHRYFRIVAENAARGFPPVWWVHGRGAGAPPSTPAAPRALPAPPVTHVLCFRRAPPSYFSPATARPSQLSSCLPEVNFQRQVRTPGEGLLVAGHRAVLGSGSWVWAAGLEWKGAPLASFFHQARSCSFLLPLWALLVNAVARLISFRLRCVQSLD